MLILLDIEIIIQDRFTALYTTVLLGYNMSYNESNNQSIENLITDYNMVIENCELYRCQNWFIVIKLKKDFISFLKSLNFIFHNKIDQYIYKNLKWSYSSSILNIPPDSTVNLSIRNIRSLRILDNNIIKIITNR